MKIFLQNEKFLGRAIVHKRAGTIAYYFFKWPYLQINYYQVDTSVTAKLEIVVVIMVL